MAETTDTLSLYFGLHEGRKADLEVVSRAAIEWVNSIRHASEIIEPNSVVRIEFVNAHESSLSINTVLEWTKSKAQTGIERGVSILDTSESFLERFEKSKYPNLKKLVIALVLFGIIDATGVIDDWFGGPDELELNQEDRDLIKEAIQKLDQSNELKRSNRQFFNILGRDPSIQSVGICKTPREKPIFSVPSTQFAERGGLWELESEPQERYAERIADVVLEMPNLSPKDRKWRFLDTSTGDTFTARMKDQSFIESLANGEIQESLRQNIKMQVTIRFKEELNDDSWESIPSTIEVTKVTLG